MSSMLNPKAWGVVVMYKIIVADLNQHVIFKYLAIKRRFYLKYRRHPAYSCLLISISLKLITRNAIMY